MKKNVCIMSKLEHKVSLCQ